MPIMIILPIILTYSTWAWPGEKKALTGDQLQMTVGRPFQSTEWDELFGDQETDFMHADCNGDGRIDE